MHDQAPDLETYLQSTIEGVLALSNESNGNAHVEDILQRMVQCDGGSGISHVSQPNDTNAQEPGTASSTVVRNSAHREIESSSTFENTFFPIDLRLDTHQDDVLLVKRAGPVKSSTSSVQDMVRSEIYRFLS